MGQVTGIRTTNLILADDHPALLAGLEISISMSPCLKVVGKARNSTELIELLDAQQCDVLVCDYCMPGGAYGDGMQMLSYLRRHYPTVNIIVYTMIENNALTIEARRLGVRAVICKSQGLSVMLGKIVELTGSAESVPNNDSLDGPDINATTLTAREFEVLRLYLGGASITAIAEQLRRTQQTVSTQKTSAMRKLGLLRDVDLFRFAHQKGIV